MLQRNEKCDILPVKKGGLNMKKRFTCALLCAALIFTAIALPATAEPLLQGRIGQNTLNVKDMRAFEGNSTGYESYMTTYDDHTVRLFKRKTEKTSLDFNLYCWEMLEDQNGKPIPFDTTNYVVIEYYYESPDAEPALTGSHMKWVQGAIVPANDLGDKTSVYWGTVPSENTIVANQWSTLVVPLCENTTYASAQKQYSKKEYYLHQYKMFPLEKDMGMNDVLYLGNITFQSWNPENKESLQDRTVRYYTSDQISPENVFLTDTGRDLATVVVKDFDVSKLPENSAFSYWIDNATGTKYKPGDEMRLLNGADVSMVPVFNLSFDFSSLETAYITGYPDGTFRPQNPVTRAEACKILSCLINPTNVVLGTVSYADVPADAWYANYVATLEYYGALSLWKDAFNGDEKITREELVTIVYNIADHNRRNMKFTYVSDVSAEDSCYDAVMYSISEGIVAGYEDGSFKPSNNITRAETVTVINRFIGRLPSGETGISFTDIEGHWGKNQIAAAAADKSSGAWTLKETAESYQITGTSAADYVPALHAQAKKNLSADAVRAGIDTVSEQMKKDILGTKNTEDYYGDKMTGIKWYVSELHGNDDNDGKTPETAVKTIEGLSKKIRLAKAGTAVLFERGGIYRGHIGTVKGLIYGSYGEGDKPIIIGSSHDYASAEYWEETDVPNVYRCTEALNNVGIMAFDHDLRAHGNYDALYGNNCIFTVDVATYADLKEDLEFFSCANDLYLYSAKGNPGTRFSSIEIGTRTNIISGTGTNVIIDNLSLKYGGAHGIGYGSTNGLTVTNCEFSWIGGSLLGDYGQTTTQYGNAVEIFGSCDGYYVHNNWMYQIYDTAVTHQYSSSETRTMNDIQYTNNLMEYVHWGIEFYNTGSSSECTMTNYRAAYNVLRNGGYGWGSIVTNRQKAARLYCGSVCKAGKNENMLCEYNVIDRCAGYLMDTPSNTPEVYRSNIYVQSEGCYAKFRGRGTVCDSKTADTIFKSLGDADEVFILEKVQ